MTTSDSGKGGALWSVLDVVFRLGLGVLFVYSGLIKILDIPSFKEAVAAYQMLPDFAVPILAYVLPVAEWIVGVGLLATKWSRVAAWGVMGLLMVFFIGLTQAIARGLDISCGCFGSEEGGRGALLLALLRDIGLMVPTVWLVCRSDRWLFPLWRPLPGVLAVLASAVYAFWPAPRISAEDDAALEKSILQLQQAGSTNVVVAEKWTTDFPQALARARAEKRPLVMFVSNAGCKFCKLLLPALRSKAMETWTKNTGIYLAEAHLSETNASPQQWALVQFLAHMPAKEKIVLPTVGVYWPDAPKGELRTHFPGRRDRMPSNGQHKYVMGEFFMALDNVLADYLKTKAPRPTVEEVIESSARYMKVASTDGAHVWMSPKDGRQVPGATVRVLTKVPAGKRLVAWEGPDGKPVPGSDTWFIPLGDNDPVGTYRPLFEDVKPKPKGVKHVSVPIKKKDD